jgi:hypothetical protein
MRRGSQGRVEDGSLVLEGEAMCRFLTEHVLRDEPGLAELLEAWRCSKVEGRQDRAINFAGHIRMEVTK